jgi:ribonucleoside-diphosphate reductase beta chain
MLFEEQISRKPNKYPWTQDYIDVMWNGFWTPNEFDFKADLNEYKTQLTEQERTVITRALSAIGQIEIAVKTFWSNLGNNLPHPAMSDLGYVMGHTEVVHNKSYEKLLDVLGLDDVFEENLKVPVIKNRVKYLRKYQKAAFKDNRKQYIYSIILFTLFVENVSLFSQFYTILWFNREKGMLKDTAQQVQYTKNEEMIHALIGIKLINTLRSEYPELFDAELEARIREEVQEAIIAESNLIDWMLDGFNQPKLRPELLKSFVRSRMDDSLVQIGFERIFNEVSHPDTLWMEEETLGNNMTDFFHKKPVEYSKNDRAFESEELF